jgi:hypothetical protein
MSLFLMIMVDTYLVYSQSTASEGTPTDFYHELAEDLIDDNFDGAAAGGRSSRENTTLSSTRGAPRSGVDIH